LNSFTTPGRELTINSASAETLNRSYASQPGSELISSISPKEYDLHAASIYSLLTVNDKRLDV